MWQIIFYGLSPIAGFYAQVAIGVEIAARVHARWTPEPKTFADEIRDARRASTARGVSGAVAGEPETAVR